MDNAYLLETIETTMERTNAELNELFNTPNDSLKVGRLLQIAGELQGELCFLRGHMEVKPAKKSRNPFKR